MSHQWKEQLLPEPADGKMEDSRERGQLMGTGLQSEGKATYFS